MVGRLWYLRSERDKEAVKRSTQIHGKTVNISGSDAVKQCTIIPAVVILATWYMPSENKTALDIARKQTPQSHRHLGKAARAPRKKEWTTLQSTFWVRSAAVSGICKNFRPSMWTPFPETPSGLWVNAQKDRTGHRNHLFRHKPSYHRDF
jgi:hypothetical protein